MIIQMVTCLYTDDILSSAPNVFDANQDISLRPAPGIHETPCLFLQQLGLLVLTRLDEAILFLLEVQRRTFFLVEQPLK